MKPARVFVSLVALLTTTLLVQVAWHYRQKPQTVETFAVWKDNPANIKAAMALAKHVVYGKVASIERAEDLVIKAAGEPGSEVHIPIEVVTIQVEKTLKGSPGKAIRLFHTGSSVGTPVYGRADPPDSERPPRPEGGVDRPAQVKKPAVEEARTVMIEDDPLYEVGHRYALLLTDGPTVKVRGAAMPTLRVVAPAGRYFITPENTLVPVAKRGFALQMNGKSVGQFEQYVRPTPR